MSLLAAYYAAQEQELGTRSTLNVAQAKKIGTEASEIGANDAADRALKAAQGGALTAGASKQSAEAAQVAPDAAAQRGLQGAQANSLGVNAGLAPGIAGSEAGLRSSQASALTTGASVQQGGLASENDLRSSQAGLARSQALLPGFAMGTTDVAVGKGQPGPTDTVPAMLTPGEGVLNKGAMQHYGTDVIQHMNQMGLMRMAAQSETAASLGLPDPHAAPAVAAGGKQATATPGAKANVVTPSSVSPRISERKASQGTTGRGPMAPATPVDMVQHFAKGGVVMPTLLDHMPSTIDPTSYAMGILHAVGTGPMGRPQKALPAASGPK